MTEVTPTIKRLDGIPPLAVKLVRDQNGQQLAYIYFEDERGGHPPRSFSPKTMKDRREYC
jgi:hypothetical protein